MNIKDKLLGSEQHPNYERGNKTKIRRYCFI